MPPQDATGLAPVELHERIERAGYTAMRLASVLGIACGMVGRIDKAIQGTLGSADGDAPERLRFALEEATREAAEGTTDLRDLLNLLREVTERLRDDLDATWAMSAAQGSRPALDPHGDDDERERTAAPGAHLGSTKGIVRPQP